MHSVHIGTITINNNNPAVLIAGPCQIETEQQSIAIAKQLKKICTELGIGYIFKASFDKANRTAHNSQRGLGLDAGLRVLANIKAEIDCPVLTDIHEAWQAKQAAAVVDVIQIPAFLCRQTDLLVAAGHTKCAVNIKKGQFMPPDAMRYAIDKVLSTGNANILLTERGTSFGYNNLVVDMRGLPIMMQTGFPVIIDATHAVQYPSSNKGISSGDRRFVPTLAQAALSLGIAGVFIETHPNPAQAWSDGDTMIALDDMPLLLKQLSVIDRVAKDNPIRLV